ncbi:lymphocyte antigen 96 [Rhineura floridana]|uniref:lymphocyte antigen 96 n=1 Tax=Rhineura floridana TaxID=261503 RepID=UPI002AC7E6F4|nr:lymphocyte antigen 96 [Rhineura floridana]
MFQFVMILSVCGFTVAQEKRLLCRTDDLDILYSNCSGGPHTNTFSFEVEPCSLKDHSVWMGTIFWIPRADLTILSAHVSLSFKGFEAIKWESVLCHGVDDDYTFCGALKGETINTTVRISGAMPTYPKGEYTVIFKGFSGYYEELIACMNYTVIIKQQL